MKGIEHTIPIVEYTPEVVDTICCMLGPLNHPAVVICCIDKSVDWLDDKAAELEDLYMHIAVLWHHPDEPRIIRGHPAPSPGIPILIIQDRNRLKQAKQELAKTDYYSAWKD